MDKISLIERNANIALARTSKILKEGDSGGGDVSTPTTFFVYGKGTDIENGLELEAALVKAQEVATSSNLTTILVYPGNYQLSQDLTINSPIRLLSIDNECSINLVGGYSILVNANYVTVRGVNTLTNPFNINYGLVYLNFEKCKGGDYSFLYGLSTSTFKSCVGGNHSFKDTAQGTYIDCSAGDYSFGYNGNVSGTFINCNAGYYSFGGNGTASGVFINCSANTFSFGRYYATGLFKDCKGTDFGFGSGYTGIASGIFKNCESGALSFGGSAAAFLTGKLFYCRMTSGTFKTVSSGGRTYYCVDGNGNTNNQ